MNKPYAFGSLVFLALYGLPVLAAPAPSANTLRDAIERAVLENPEVRLRAHNLEAVQAEARSAAGGWWPRIDLEAATGQYDTRSPTQVSGLRYNGNYAQLVLRQTLFDGFATRHETRRLRYAGQAAYYDFLSASSQTALEAGRAYLDVQRYRELVQLAADNFTAHQEVHERLSQKVSAGVGRKVDLEQAAGRMALAESNWLTDVSNLHDVSARYQRLIGQVPAANLSPAKALPIQTENVRTFGAQAIRQNPEFLSAVSTLRAYRADNQVRRAAYAPTVELRARQSQERNQNGINGDYHNSAVELVLNYNLFRGGADKARVQQYVAKLASAHDLRDKACRDVWQTGAIAVNDAQKLTNQIKLLAQHELSTSKARQAYQQQFDIGQRSLLDVLDTENELYQARRALTNAEIDLQLATLRVHASAGTLLGALKLQSLPVQPPASTESDADEAEDGLMQCNTEMVAAPVLDRTAPPRPIGTPPAPVAVAAAKPPAPPSAPCELLPKVVQDWLQAWNRKDLNAYLATYSERFVPAKGMGRKQWEAMRKSRILKQGGLTITIGDIKPIQCDAKTADIAFPQEYGSADYRDQVEKVLSLERVDGVWKIVRETVTKGRTY